MTDPLRVLLVEDSPEDVVNFRRILGQYVNGAQFEVHDVGDLHAALADLSGAEIIVADLTLPDSDGLDTLRPLIASGLPVVAMTGMHEELGRDAIRAGAQDFLIKSKLTPGSLARTLVFSWERAQLAKLCGRK